MKKDIHPQYNKDITVTCSCGNTLKTGSTSDNMTVEICSNCHPFYTGKSKMLDAQGRVERFKKLMKQKVAKPTKTKKEKKAGAKAKKEAKKVEK